MASKYEILQFIEENDVKFVRLNFCDVFGNQKNFSIISTELENAIENGVPFNASLVLGFEGYNDLLLFPDPKTLSILPWRPHSGRVVRFYCNIKNIDGSDFVHDSRYMLKNSVKKLDDLGITAEFGTECEFYLFKCDQDGNPTKTPLDIGSYLDTAPLDRGEDIRREICFGLEDMGLEPISSHHENGPGQNEIDFKMSSPLESADNLLTFKALVKAIANRNGLFASFMPKPLSDKSGNALHLNISLYKDNKNIFDEPCYNNISESFIAGILEKTEEIIMFLNPTINSYKRLGFGTAPKLISKADNFISKPYSKKPRIKLRLLDPTVNPYIAFALIIRAGVYGIENNLKLDDTKKELPKDLESAIKFAKNSDFAKQIITNDLLDKYVHHKEIELKNYNNSENQEEFEFNNYFLYL